MRKAGLFILMVIVIVSGCVAVSAQTTAFSYQGSLKDGAVAANGNYDFQFALFDAVSGGSQLGSTLTQNSVTVSNGNFSVSLDFGSQFPGANRFLEIRVRLTGQPSLTTLAPRQPVNSAPYSVKSLNTDTATNAAQLGGVAANQYVVTTDPRMTDSRTPTAGSTNYIQNQDAVPQASSNFNISGTGTASFINAATQFNLNSSRIISAPSNNLFVGLQTGQSNTTGDSNSFFGRSAGSNNTSGGNNSFFGFLAGNTTNIGNGNAFFGYSAGRSNTTGGVNSYFGFNAGEFSTNANYNSFFGYNAGNKTTADDNSFFGASAGQANTSGTFNTFVGRNAGFSNTTSGSHVFVGVNAGYFNTTGGSNTFVGKDAGFANNTGGENSFFGAAAGQSNTIGGNNTFVGATAGLLNTIGGDNSFMGHAAGYSNTAGIQNSFFGLDAGRSNQTGNNNSFFGMKAGTNTTSSENSIFGAFAGQANTNGTSNSFFGSAAGSSNMIGNSNSFFGRNAGSVTTGNDNSFFGVFAGGFNSTGIRNTAIGYNANVGSGNLQYATAIGADSTVSSSNTIALGRSNGSDQVVIPGNLVVSGSFAFPPGNPNYIQNGTTVQALSNFNISGSGVVGASITANSVNSQSLSSTNSLFLNATAGGRIALRTSGPTERMTILDDGSVGIGLTNPVGFNVYNHLIVDQVGNVQVRLRNFSSSEHVCYFRALDPGQFVTCASAAEYAPSIDSGAGFPETADLVSIAPGGRNPYGDSHGPFTVEKSVTACDANLFGFILKPESGADGPKLNDHYLPLAIYGYFPAKVTLENGPIKRGDPITSSSKAGFGMKATNACKIIGYALEDADEEGKIQVFAHLGEYSAPVVAELQLQIEKLKSEKNTELESLKARLAALEQIVLSTEKSSK